MRAPQLLIAVLAVHAVAVAISAVQAPRPAGDFDRYYEIGSGAGRPYVDYQVEHPVATLLVFKALARLPGGRADFGRGIVVLDLIADAVILGSLIWGWGFAAAAFGGAALVPAIGLFFNRVDAWSTACAILAVAAWRKDRPAILGCALAAGAAFKLWPLVLATLLVVPWRERRSWTALAAFAATAALFAAAALWLAGANGLTQVVTFRGATGWQIESLTGSLVHLFDRQTLRLENGAWRIGTMGRAWSVAMFLAAAPICIWSSWRGARLDRVGAGWLASVTSLLLLSPLLSAQYVIWLAPAAAIAWVQGDKRLAALTAIAILLTQVLWTYYGAILNHSWPGMLLVVGRNLLLMAIVALAIARLHQPRRAGLAPCPRQQP